MKILFQKNILFYNLFMDNNKDDFLTKSSNFLYQLLYIKIGY